MDVRRRASGVALAAILLAAAAPARTVLAQTVAAPPPTAVEKRNAEIVNTLVEIGRVRARTPYCAALAAARPGIDAAVAFEYQTPVLADDLRHWRYDSELHRVLILKKTEADLATLWNLALAGRDQVRALRTAALADGIDDERRTEMLAIANAVDGAKERQKQLAKQIARSVGTYAESPISTIANSAEDAARGQSRFGVSIAAPGRSGPSAGAAPPAPSQYAQLHPEDIQQFLATQQMFDNFASEYRIRDDMAVAAQHAKAAMQLGGCSSN